MAVILAVISQEVGGDGWESNPPRTPQQRPADGCEDPCGRVQFRTGPEGPVTQRSINLLGVSRIFRPTFPYYRSASPYGCDRLARWRTSATSYQPSTTSEAILGGLACSAY